MLFITYHIVLLFLLAKLRSIFISVKIQQCNIICFLISCNYTVCMPLFNVAFNQHAYSWTCSVQVKRAAKGTAWTISNLQPSGFPIAGLLLFIVFLGLSEKMNWVPGSHNHIHWSWEETTRTGTTRGTIRKPTRPHHCVISLLFKLLSQDFNRLYTCVTMPGLD